MNKIYTISGFAEPVSSWTHLIAAGVFLCLGLYLIYRQGKSMGRFISLSVFGFSCVFLLSMSGVYHLLPDGGTARLVFQRIDHAAIFVLIAGTFTAVHGTLFTGIWRWGMIAVVWIASVTFITLKTIFFNDTPELLGLTAYIALGWLGLITGIALWRRHGFSFIKPLVYGGLAYSIGAVLDFLHQPVLIPGVIGPHEVFHVAVVFGISFHWWFISSSFEYKNKALQYA